MPDIIDPLTGRVDLAALDPAYARDIAIAKRKREQAALAAQQASQKPVMVSEQPSLVTKFQDALAQKIKQETAAIGNSFGTAEERAQQIVQARRREEAKTFGQ